MIGRLFIWVLVYLVPIGAAGYFTAKVARPRLRLWLEKNRRQRLGARNAKRLEYAAHELCLVCQKRINPEVDIFDERNDKWLHVRCHHELLGEEFPALEIVAKPPNESVETVRVNGEKFSNLLGTHLHERTDRSCQERHP